MTTNYDRPVRGSSDEWSYWRQRQEHRDDSNRNTDEFHAPAVQAEERERLATWRRVEEALLAVAIAVSGGALGAVLVLRFVL